MQRRKLTLIVLSLVIVFIAAYPVSAAGGKGRLAPVYGVGTPGSISGRYIVVFKEGTASGDIDNAAAGKSVHYRYDAALKGFAASMTNRSVQALQRNPNVAFIEADRVVRIDTTQTPATWGLSRIDQRTLPLDSSYTYNYTGIGVTAYILDTGLRYSHDEFGGRASFGYDSFGGIGEDCNGHGTHVAGTVAGSTYGVAKGVSLVAVRVLDCSGSGTTSGVIAGVNWVTAAHTGGAALANMSLTGNGSKSMDAAVANSIADGVVYVLAAGNNKKDACRYSPARVPEALTVGATTSLDERASYSNYGACLDLFAPGSSITSAWYTSDTALNTISGTSMAAPHAAGVAALYLEAYPGTSPADVVNALTGGATPNVVTNAGLNSPNLLLYSLFFP